MSRIKSASFACLVTALFMLASPGNVVGQGGPDPDDVAEEVGKMGNETLARTEEPMPWAPLREAESLLDGNVYAGWVVADPTVDPEVNPDGVEYHFADMSSIPCDAEEAGDEVTITLALHLAFRFPANAEVADWRLTGEVLRPLEPDDPDGWVLHGSNITQGHEISATSGTPPLEPEDVPLVSDALAATESVLIPFNHSANPFNTTSYVLSVAIETIYLDVQNATAGYARSMNATEIIVEPCPSSSLYMDARPLTNVTAPPPPTLPVADGYGMHEDGVEPIEVKYQKQLVSVGGSDPGILATATVHDWYMVGRAISACEPGPPREGFDSEEEFADFYYLIEVDGAARLDFYTAIIKDDLAIVYGRGYAEIPEAGTWCFASDGQPLRDTYGSLVRGHGISAAFINGNGGFLSGDYIYADTYRIDPYAHETTLDGGSCTADPRPSFETTYSTSDTRVTRVMDLHTTYVDRVHRIASQFISSGTGYMGTAEIGTGQDFWRVCFELPIDPFGRAGDWWHIAKDVTPEGRHHWFPSQDFTIEGAAPGSFSLIGPSDGATVSVPVTFSWTAASDSDGSGVEYELLTKQPLNPTYSVAWSGSETSVTLPWPTGNHDWKVHAVNAAYPTAFTSAGPRSFTGSGTDADGDGVANDDDIDPDHDVDMLFRLREVESDRQLYDPRIVVNFGGPSDPATWTWADFIEQEFKDGYRYSPVFAGSITTPSFIHQMSDHATELPVSAELRARLSPDGQLQLLDINDATDQAGLHSRPCEFTVDTLTGWWENSAGERHWTPNSDAEHTNNGFGMCGEDGINLYRLLSGWNHHPFGRDRLFFDIELTDGDGDRIPRDYEESHSGLSASTDDRYVTSGDPDSGRTEEYQDWYLRIRPGNPKAGDRITMTYWLDWTPTAAEADLIRRQLATATTQFHALTNGHIWIDKWERVPQEKDARLRIWNECTSSSRDDHWPRARMGGISVPPDPETGFIAMPTTYDNCAAGQVRSWEETLYYKSLWAQTLVHELSHYVMWGAHTSVGPENFLGDEEPIDPETGDPKPPHPEKYPANCWTRLSHSAPSVLASTIMGGRSGFIQNNDGPGDAGRTGPDARACWHAWPYRSHAHQGQAMCDYRTDHCHGHWFYRENQTLWSVFVERYTDEENPGIVWDFDRTGTGVPAASHTAANTDLFNRFKQYAGPFDPVHRITVVTTL